MGLYSENKYYKLYLGKMQDELKNIDSNSIDSIVTDPPYELNFMSKDWDNSGVAFQKETWQECLRVLKPGGYLLAFGGSRTFHRIAVAIEDAGFEIRDTIMWLYGSGFPKSMNIGLAIDKKIGNESKVVGEGRSGTTSRAYQSEETTTAGVYQLKEAQNEWDGWGTCLKPAYEPIIMARKPLEGSCTDNVLKYGVGGINIDGCRVGNDYISGGTTPDLSDVGKKQKEISGMHILSFGQVSNAERIPYEGHYGRFPANIITDGSEEVAKGFPITKSTGGSGESSIKSGLSGAVYQGGWKHNKAGANIGGLGDEGSAMRYFYCAKASKKDRDEGLYDFESKVDSDRNPECYSANVPFNRSATARKNTHPTVKPTELMQYLVRLISPKGAVILDPFMGSGSTGKAVMIENAERNSNYQFIGIEMTEEYLPICLARINFGLGYAEEAPEVETKEETQVNIEDKKAFRKVSLF